MSLRYSLKLWWAGTVLLFFSIKLVGQSDSIEIVYDTLAVADTAAVMSYALDQYGEVFFESKNNYIKDFYFERARFDRRSIATTGNLGSPAQDFIFDTENSIDQYRLFNPYRHYEINRNNFRFLKAPLDYSIVKYNQALGAQSDLNIRAKVLKNWSDNLSMTVDFDRMSQAEGQFNHQATRNTILGIGFDYRAPAGNYRLNLLYTRNKVQQQFNWGLIEPDSIRIPQDENSLNFDSFSSTAEGAYETTNISVLQDYQLFKPDSNRLFNGLIYHEIEYLNSIHHYTDNSPDTFYGNFLVDSRAMRFWFQNRQIINEFGLGLQLWEDHDFRFGINHRYFWIDNDLDKFNEQELRINGKAKGPVGEWGKYQAELEFPFYSNVGRIKINGNIHSPLIKDKIELTLAYQFLKQSPHYSVENLIVSQQKIDQGSILDPVSQKISGQVSFFRMLNLDISYFNFQNPYYFDQNFALVQRTSNYSAITAAVDADIELWRFRLRPTLKWQQLPSFYYLPSWLMDADLYYSQKLFQNNLDLFVGTNVRVINTYRPYRFLPIVNTFGLQDNYLSPDYPILDIYAGIHVSGFRFFVRMENALAQFDNQLPLAELVYRQPQFTGYFRLGIVWSFYN